MKLKKQEEYYKEKLKETKAKLKQKSNLDRKTTNTKFFTFDQNNSGGSFDQNDNVDIYVIIEAKNAKEANLLADDVGIYFDGCETGQDCSHCGDRWYPASDSSGDSEPMIYGKPAKEYEVNMRIRENMNCIVYYLNGDKKSIKY